MPTRRGFTESNRIREKQSGGQIGRDSDKAQDFQVPRDQSRWRIGWQARHDVHFRVLHFKNNEWTNFWRAGESSDPRGIPVKTIRRGLGKTNHEFRFDFSAQYYYYLLLKLIIALTSSTMHTSDNDTNIILCTLIHVYAIAMEIIII